MTTPSSIVEIDGTQIKNWASFHQVCFDQIGFPDYYGRNQDAWIDCMSDPDLCSKAQEGLVTLHIRNSEAFRTNAPDVWSSFVEMSALVNWRRIENGESPVLALSYDS